MKTYNILCKNNLILICKKHIMYGIVFEEDYNLIIVFKITLAQNFIFNVKITRNT